MLDALCFALFNRPFRDIKKPQLINSINGKGCYVEVEFSVMNKEYKIIRGMKPNVFEIWCDGVMLNQDAAARDYQNTLEQQILKLNYKSFTQVVILGSAAFVPFMQLPSHQRREVIEDILDISIFSTMNQILKERASSTKDEISSIESAIATLKERVGAQKKLIQTITSAKTTTIENIQTKIREIDTEISTTQDKQTTVQTEVESLIQLTSEESSIRDDLRRVQTTRTKVDSKSEALSEKIRFISESETCPSCAQGIPHEHKSQIVSESQVALAICKDEELLLEQCYEKLNEKLQRIGELNRQLTQKNIELSTLTNSISMQNKQIVQLRKEIENHQNDNTNLDEEKENLREIAQQAMDMIVVKDTLLERRNLQDIAALLLKDTGIKTAIIREYLPIMNKLINKYLNVMDSYIHFELDESFNEVIKSRFRDEFSYASFSEGEKQRIDLAILFTWRQIAKMKNSVNTNLLIFDEIMDSSLDTNGTEAFMSLLGQFGEDTNIFVISHKGDILFDKFHSVIKIEKKNDFSTIV
jgi:DNA repair exonuclease SbcCD ATPase subunit